MYDNLSPKFRLVTQEVFNNFLACVYFPLTWVINLLNFTFKHDINSLKQTNYDIKHIPFTRNVSFV